MQTFFIHNKPVIIGATADKDQLSGFAETEFSNLLLLQEPDQKEIPALIHALKDESSRGYLILSDRPDRIFHLITSEFSHWQAAGGLVSNTAGEFLLLFRKGKWDLPKGKMEKDETPEETALREVSEETGLQNIHITKKLTETWHSYPLSVYKDNLEDKNVKDILKQTHWFAMSFTGNELTIPQIEEDIIDIQWIKPENIEKYLKYSYPNLKLVFKAAGYL